MNFTHLWPLAMAGFLLVLSSFASAKDERPNIVIIFADDLGYGDLSSYGAKGIKTPNLDQLAKDGVHFTDSYAISPVCTPSRAGLLTGRYPVRMGIHGVFFNSSYTGMPVEEVTLAELLGSAGYRTAMFGKWHLGHHEKYMPNAQGFEYFYGYPYSNDITPYYAFENTEIAEWEVDQSQITQKLTSKSADYIAQNSDHPFFLYLAHPMPHIPLANSEKFTGSSQRGQYGDVIQELDWSVGQIKAALEQQGILDNTLILFASDNGPWLMAQEDGGSAGPLRSGKGTTFEGGMRVPTIAHWPAGMPQGLTYNGISHMLDWFPTIAAMAEIEPDQNIALDGINLLPLLESPNQEPAERKLAYYNNGDIEAFRQGDWKLKLPDVKPRHWIERLLVEGANDGVTDIELYNLGQDISEENNLAQQHPNKVIELQQAINTFKEVIGPVPEGLDDGLRLKKSSLKYTFKKVMIILVSSLLTFSLLLILGGYYLGKRKNKS